LAFAFQPRDEAVGRYHVFAQFARGGMAELCVARLLGAARVEKLVVIKRMLPHLIDDPDHIAMFENEARIATRLNHPNVCQTYDFDEANGQRFLVMEFLRGLPWSEAIDLLPSGEVPRLRFLVGVIMQACEGLFHAHHLVDVDGQVTPIVHRDVSPGNLMITTDGVIKLLDFGVSKDITAEAATQVGMIKGKLPYMAPEQIRGEPVDGRADIFSLGVMLWEALARARLFDRGSDFQIWKAVTEGPIPPLPSTPVTACLQPVVMRALARDREARPSTARMFADELRDALAPFGTPMAQHEIQAALTAWMQPSLIRDGRELANAISQVRIGDSETARRSKPKVQSSASSPVIEYRAAVTQVHDVADPLTVSRATVVTPYDHAPDAAPRAPMRPAPEPRPSSIQLRNVSVLVTNADENLEGPTHRQDTQDDDMLEAVTAPRRFVAPPSAPVIPVSTPTMGAERSAGYGLRWVIALILVSIVAGVIAALALGRGEPLAAPRDGGHDSSAP